MDLRLFPLNTVLFPNMRLPLHIFEERYKLMIRECIEEDAPFGVVLIQTGEEVGSTAAPHQVGTTARIIQVEYLDDGRMNIFTMGERRFRIEREETGDTLYRSVQASLLPEPGFGALADDAQRRLADMRGELEARMLELVRLTAPASAEQLAERMRALDPLLLLNALSFGLDCPTLEKQSLLEAANPVVQGELLLRILIIRIAEARLPEGPKIVN